MNQDGSINNRIILLVFILNYKERFLLVCKDSTKTAEALIYKGFYGFVFEI